MEPITKEFLIDQMMQLELRIDRRMDKRFKETQEEFQRYIGVVSENFQWRLEAMAETMATKKDLERFATKEDLKKFVTKDEFEDRFGARVFA